MVKNGILKTEIFESLSYTSCKINVVFFFCMIVRDDL